MSQKRATDNVSKQFSHFEPLEKRQLLSLTIDVRLPNGGTAASITKVGQVIALEAWATAVGSNNTGTDDGVHNAFGSFYSKNINGGGALGDISVTLTPPFNGTNSSTGSQADLDGDGDLDVGDTEAPAEGGIGLGYFFARSNTATTTGGTLLSNGQSFKIADITFTVIQILGNSGSYTDLKFVPRDFGTGQLTPVDAVWREDGATKSYGGLSGVGTTYKAGTSVRLAQNIGLISGKVFNDKNGNGAFDGKDTRLKGIQLYIDSNANSILELGERSVRSTGSGLYTFPNLKAGTYKVRVNVPPAGFRQTKPGVAYTVKLGIGDAATGRNFGYSANTLITGSVFDDANGNGVKDSLETVKAGWRVFADVNGDGVFGNATDRGVLTDTNGNFSLGSLPAGTWTIRASLVDGMQITTPVSGSYVVTLAAAQSSTPLVFGVAPVV